MFVFYLSTSRTLKHDETNGAQTATAHDGFCHVKIKDDERVELQYQEMHSTSKQK